MKLALFVLASAGLLASGVAAADSTTASSHDISAAIVPVQYYRGEQYARGDDRFSSINEREARIANRIQRGLSDGRITEREARRLYRQLTDIEAKERAFRSDRRLDRREFAQLNQDLDRLAENVRYQMHDEQRRY